MYSGSEAEASQRLLRMKMLGLESLSLTLWKKDFSCMNTARTVTWRGLGARLTVCISVDSALATRTNTSASRQNLSIQLSSSVVTSIPGLEGKQEVSGQRSGERQHQVVPQQSTLGFGPHDGHQAAGVQVLVLVQRVGQLPSVRRKASLPSVPSTRRKQLVVCPIPEGSTLSHSMALITELFPLLVLESRAQPPGRFESLSHAGFTSLMFY
ncbi:hypothetical protein EYF80_054289 [Liparis tanakae]|uniref:Uncharacterized protein n=1 Tax=Liparis tanakae TaxID=230148 RepID=A0A4Z2F463_9TELE|nr:hypothetical protein EYF80_054289 [Liparis tanakae]